MQHFLNEVQQTRQREFRAYVARHVEPCAAEWDRAEGIPAEVVRGLAAAGYLGATLPGKFGGQGWDAVTFGLLNEAFGRGSAALTDLLTVQSMVAMTLVKWGREEQQARWLPRLAQGEVVAAYALTEAGGGSDLQGLQTRFTPAAGGSYLLDGAKSWISFGQSAGLFLVFGTADGQPLACLVPRDAEGLSIEPIRDLLGFRAAGLARLAFHKVRIPTEDVIGRPGAALHFIAPVGLQYGRISTACSAVGLLRGCLEAAIARAATRAVGAGRVGDFGATRAMIARMGTDLEAAGLLCLAACRAADEHSPAAFHQVLMAKYFASRAAVRAAADAVQIWGAEGCHEASPVARRYRDAKVYEIIEGTSQIHEDLLGRAFLESGVNRSPQA